MAPGAAAAVAGAELGAGEGQAEGVRAGAAGERPGAAVRAARVARASRSGRARTRATREGLNAVPPRNCANNSVRQPLIRIAADGIHCK